MQPCKAGIDYLRVDDIETPCVAPATKILRFQLVNPPRGQVELYVCDLHRDLILKDDLGIDIDS